MPDPPLESPRLEFDVASVRPSRTGKASSNVPLGPGNVLVPSGGVLNSKNMSLLTCLEFAYRLADYQSAAIREKLPDWATSHLYTIEARTDMHEVTKDQLRLMMRSLLAERFKVAIHYETRQVPVYALVPLKPGSVGPKLRAHPDAFACSTTEVGTPFKDAGNDGGFPVVCGGILGLPASAQDRYSFGASNVPMDMVARSFSSWGNLDRPVIDETGLAGKYDFVLDYTPDPRPTYATIDSGGPTFQAAVQKQLGLKLESQKGPVEFMVLDHVERPDAN